MLFFERTGRTVGKALDDRSTLKIFLLTLAEDAGYVRCYFNQNRDNMVLQDIGAAVKETLRYKSLGGSTIGT